MKVYTETEFPEICYLSEAVAWLAFGRPPKVDFIRQEGVRETGVDFRLRNNIPRHSHQSEFIGPVVIDTRAPFTKSEFDTYGIEIDYDKYECNFYETFGLSYTEYLDMEAKGDIKLCPDVAPYYRGEKSLDDSADIGFMLRSVVSEVLETAKFRKLAIEKEMLFNPAIDKARSKLSKLLKSEKLDVYGWVETVGLKKESLKEGDHLGEYREIPKNLWDIGGIQWEDSELRYRGATFLGILIGMEKLLTLHPTPLVKSELTNVRTYAGAIIVDSNDTVSSQIKKPGDKPKPACRPRKQELFLKAYREIFPDGHGDSTWPKVMRTIKDETGLVVHPDTLKRALGLR